MLWAFPPNVNMSLKCTSLHFFTNTFTLLSFFKNHCQGVNRSTPFSTALMQKCII